MCTAPRTQALRRRRHWPMAASTIHWSKHAHPSIRRVSSSLTLANLEFWIGKLSPTVHSRYYSWLGSDPVNSAATVLEEWSRHLSLQESDGISCSMRQCTILLKDETQPWDIRNISGNSFLARRLSRYYAPFTLTPGSIKWISVQPLISYYLRVMQKFSRPTFVFNNVVRWHEWGEMENVYIAYNFSHFWIYLPKVIKIDGNLTKFWKNNFAQFFSETRCICYKLYTCTWLCVACLRWLL